MISEHPSIAWARDRFSLDFTFADQVISCLNEQGFWLEELSIIFSEVHFDWTRLMPREHIIFSLLMILRSGKKINEDFLFKPLLDLLNNVCLAPILPEDKEKRVRDGNIWWNKWSLGTSSTIIETLYSPVVSLPNHDWKDKMWQIRLQILG